MQIGNHDNLLRIITLANATVRNQHKEQTFYKKMYKENKIF